MTHEDSVALSQLVGGIKRARRTVFNNGGQIHGIAKRNAGTTAESLCEGGVKCLLSAVYWLDQAIDVFGTVTRLNKEAAR